MSLKKNERSPFIEEVVFPILSNNNRLRCSCTYIGSESIQYQVKIIGDDHVSCSIYHDGSDILITVVGLKLSELTDSSEEAFDKYLELCDDFNGNNHSISVLGENYILTQYHRIKSFDKSNDRYHLCMMILDALDDVCMANNFVTGGRDAV